MLYEFKNKAIDIHQQALKMLFGRDGEINFYYVICSVSKCNDAEAVKPDVL